MGFELGKDRRLRRRLDFVHVQTHGERANSRHFVFLVAAREASPEGRPPSRLGIVATRKIGNAVVRNRIKRVCRECFRLWPDFVPDGTDLVVIAREGAHQLPLAEVRSEWARARPQLLKRCASVLQKPAPRASAVRPPRPIKKKAQGNPADPKPAPPKTPNGPRR